MSPENPSDEVRGRAEMVPVDEHSVALGEEAAQRLTERIRTTAAKYLETKETLLRLVGEAKAGRAHTALGFASWPEYLSSVLSEEPMRLVGEERRELTAKLTEEGISSRAIAPILGVSYMTVVRDLGRVGTTVPPVGGLIGLDGKKYNSLSAGPIAAREGRAERIRLRAGLGHMVGEKAAFRSRKIDSNRILRVTSLDIGGLASGVGLIDFDKLQIDEEFSQHVQAMYDGLRILNRLNRDLRRIEFSPT